MDMLKVKAHIGEDGILKLEVPTGLSAREVEVVLVLQSQLDDAVDENGWPSGFFDRTYGALAEHPLERPTQPPLTERDDIE